MNAARIGLVGVSIRLVSGGLVDSVSASPSRCRRVSSSAV